MGHGTYRRQALGLPGGCREVLVWIRRFLCLACRRTISVLPDGLYPGRWYSAIAILTSLVLAVLGGVAAGRVRERFTGHPARDWRTLDRWQEQLLAPLWGWLAGQLGFSQPSDSDVRQRLQRLLMLQGVSGTGPPEDLEEVARAMLCETAHCGGLGWEMRRGRPWDGSGGGPAGV